jgi:hypothetical protein
LDIGAKLVHAAEVYVKEADKFELDADLAKSVAGKIDAVDFSAGGDVLANGKILESLLGELKVFEVKLKSKLLSAVIEKKHPGLWHAVHEKVLFQVGAFAGAIVRESSTEFRAAVKASSYRVIADRDIAAKKIDDIAEKFKSSSKYLVTDIDWLNPALQFSTKFTSLLDIVHGWLGGSISLSVGAPKGDNELKQAVEMLSESINSHTQAESESYGVESLTQLVRDNFFGTSFLTQLDHLRCVMTYSLYYWSMNLINSDMILASLLASY